MSLKKSFSRVVKFRLIIIDASLLTLCYLYLFKYIKDRFDNNELETLLSVILVLFIIKLLISIIVTFYSFFRFSKFLNLLVNDTGDMSYSGENRESHGRRYRYTEFQILDSAFKRVLEIRQKLENDLLLSIDKMEDCVRERTTELTIAVKKAEEADHSKMNLLTSVSHEIRTPMNCIIGFCEIIINESVDVESKDYSRRIIAESETLLHLINDILDQSKIESGKMVLSCNRVNLEQFIKGIISLGNPYGNKVSIDYIPQGNIPRFVGVDEIRLYQVISNIYFNALKYTRKGSVSIFVSYDNDLLEFNIIDTGIGIPTNRIDSVFEQFQQLDSELTQGFRGTGLGLTITKKIVELMGGEIFVKSEPNNGSCFTVLIPVTETNQDSAKKLDDEFKLVESSVGKKILVVEDYPTNRIVVKKHLESVGYIVIEAINGKCGVDVSLQQKFDLILMDIQMPIMNGFDAAKTIREPANPNMYTPIIAMTANGLQVISKKCKNYGINDIIVKPIRKNSFLNCINKYLTGDIFV